MAQHHSKLRPVGRVFLTRPDLTLLVCHAPRPGQPARFDVYGEPVNASDPAAGTALIAYLSPFDARLDAAILAKSGHAYHPVPATEFNPRWLIEDNFGRLNTRVHCAWAASDGRLLKRPSGGLIGLHTFQADPIAADRMDAIDLTIEPGALECYAVLRREARPAARSDTSKILNRPAGPETVTDAIHCLPDTVPPDTRLNQAALYDPVAAQWHFLPVQRFLEARELLTGRRRRPRALRA